MMYENVANDIGTSNFISAYFHINCANSIPTTYIGLVTVVMQTITQHKRAKRHNTLFEENSDNII